MCVRRCLLMRIWSWWQPDPCVCIGGTCTWRLHPLYAVALFNRMHPLPRPGGCIRSMVWFCLIACIAGAPLSVVLGVQTNGRRPCLEIRARKGKTAWERQVHPLSRPLAITHTPASLNAWERQVTVARLNRLHCNSTVCPKACPCMLRYHGCCSEAGCTWGRSRSVQFSSSSVCVRANRNQKTEASAHIVRPGTTTNVTMSFVYLPAVHNCQETTLHG